MKKKDYSGFFASSVLGLSATWDEFISRRNQISLLPDIFNYKVFQENLDFLKCHNRQIETVPETIGDLQELRYLDFSINNLTALLRSIGRLSKLKYLDLSDNPKLPKFCKINLKGCNPILRKSYEFTQLPGYAGHRFILPKAPPGFQNNAGPSNRVHEIYKYDFR